MINKYGKIKRGIEKKLEKRRRENRAIGAKLQRTKIRGKASN